MVDGIEKFRERFRDFSDQFVLIGGTACDFLMNEAGLDFRRTKDLDIVLIVEVLKRDFCKELLTFISEGDYKIQEKAPERENSTASLTQRIKLIPSK